MYYNAYRKKMLIVIACMHILYFGLYVHLKPFIRSQNLKCQKDMVMP